MSKVLEKWWFWIILSIIIITLLITISIIVVINGQVNEIKGLTSEVQGIYDKAEIYLSADKKTLILELNDWDNDYEEQLSEIINLLKSKINNDELQTYNKFVTLTYLNSNEQKNVLYIKQTYTLPNFVLEDTKEYIDFEEYKDLYNTLDNTMDSYTNLFNDIY